MRTKEVIIPKGTDFLSEVMSALPYDCLFDKSVTGCGGTTIALTNNIPSVICVPFVPLAINKQIQSKKNLELYPYEVLAVYGNVTKDDIIGYLERVSVPKIIVTYDGLKKVIDSIDPSNYYLLIDEYHCLFTQYSFRKEAVMIVLKNYTAFKNFTFMTATPIENKFILDELKDIDVVKAVWQDSVPISVKNVLCKNGVKKAIKTHILDVLSGKLKGNYYYFVNSLQFIKSMIINCNLTEENCRVIYSESNGAKFPIKRGRATDDPKKINLITSCAFEGIDFYDEDGKIIIVSDGRCPNTLLDISTEVVQICGRIRNSKYKNAIYHVISNSRYSRKLSAFEFEKMMNDQIEKEKFYVDDINNMVCAENRMKAAKTEIPLLFYKVDESLKTITLDLNRTKIDLYNYHILNSYYLNMENLSKQYKKNNIVVEWTENNSNPEILPMDDITTLKDTIVELKILRERTNLIGEHKYNIYLAAAIKTFDFLADAINIMGLDGISEMKYKKSNIKRKIIQLTPRTSATSDEARITDLLALNKTFSVGSCHLVSTVKENMNIVYKHLEINKKATAKDIEVYYHVKSITKLINGNQQRAIAILSPRIAT